VVFSAWLSAVVWPYVVPICTVQLDIGWGQEKSMPLASYGDPRECRLPPWRRHLRPWFVFLTSSTWESLGPAQATKAPRCRFILEGVALVARVPVTTGGVGVGSCLEHGPPGRNVFRGWCFLVDEFLWIGRVLLSTRWLPLGAYECIVHWFGRPWCCSIEVSIFGCDPILELCAPPLAIVCGWWCMASFGCRVSWGWRCKPLIVWCCV
jgi:hypothetical protein